MKLPRNAQIWLPDYLWGGWRRQPRPRQGEGRLWVAIADHFEPLWAGVDEDTGQRRVETWRAQWPQIAARHRDSTGQPPVYTFFYPQEEYRPFFLEPLAEMARQGIADIEVHIHHDEAVHPAQGLGTFDERMRGYLERLERGHGLLRRENGAIRFGFIHGNWALDNSLPGGRWCGLNDELQRLGRMGCYADFTMPSGASPTQAQMLNRVYWATDDPLAPGSHRWGVPVEPERPGSGDLLMIPGPLGLRWRDRLVPRLESGEISGYDLPTPYRVRRWMELAPTLGCDVFLKLFTHGAQERNRDPLLGGGLDRLFELLGLECSRRGWQLRYVSTWNLFGAVRAQQQGTSLADKTTGQL